MVRLLFVASMSFLFLSSSTALLFGLQQLRVVAFALVLASLVIAAGLHKPRLVFRGHELPMVALWLLAIIALLDSTGSFHVYDYKIFLPIVGLLVAPAIASALDGIDLARLLYRLLALYVLVMMATFALGAGNVVFRGQHDMLRVDLTGSVVTHASLCVVALVTACVIAARESGLRKSLALTVAIAAVLSIMLTGTRTALVTLVLFAVLSIIAGPGRGKQLRLAFLGIASFAIVLAFHTLAVSDTFLSRLIGAGEADYSSGRLHSLAYWLAMAAERPLGHGIGTVREMLQEGRPHIDGGLLLEWPHNELVRFYVEAGLPGLLLIIMLIAGVTRRVLRAAAACSDSLTRAAILVLAADMIAQSLLQNYFNSVYHSTILLMITAMLCSRVADARQPCREVPERFPMRWDHLAPGSSAEVEQRTGGRCMDIFADEHR